MVERAPVSYRNGDLVDMCNLGTVQLSFVLWFSVRVVMHMLNWDRC